jgi:hypothetical protein
VTPGAIKYAEDLHLYLRSAMVVEHATIPPYLTALYSIVPGTNPAAVNVLRTIVVEEMLHLTMAANILNAVGGKPDLATSDFVPSYPAYLPYGATDFQVHLQAFSQDAIATFLNIERPDKLAPPGEPRMLARPAAAVRHRTLASCPVNPDMHFYSIGEFYEEIRRGIEYLSERLGDKLFCGDPKLQVTSEYYYSGGGRLFPVTNLESAREGIRLIIEQGEGAGGGIYDHDKELAHFYRFQELDKGRYYVKGDQPNKPSGPTFNVDWRAVYPIKTDAKLSDYEAGSELYRAATAFNDFYRDYLGLLTRAYTGEPELLLQAVPIMFGLRNRITELIRNPLPTSPGQNAAATFEVYRMAEAAE